MSKQKHQSGFSALIIIIIVVAILILGAGGYYLYTNYFQKSSLLTQSNPLIPAELASIADGADASSFLIFNNNESINSLVGVLPAAQYQQDFNNLKAALFIIPSQNINVMKVYLDFKDEQTAARLKDTIYQNFKSYLSFNGEISLQGNIIIIYTDKTRTAFTGKFIDNPLLNKVNKFSDSQLVGYFNYNENFTLTLGLYSMINTIFSGLSMQDSIQGSLPKAHAQSNGFLNTTDNPSTISGVTGGQPSPLVKTLTNLNFIINFAKESVIAVKVDPQNISAQFDTTLLDKSEWSKSTIMQIAKQSHPSATIPSDEIEKVFNDSLIQLKENLPFVQDQLNQALSKFPGSSAKVSLDGLNINFSINSTTDNLKKSLVSLQQSSQDSNARANDSSAKTYAMAILVKLETYNADNGVYPSLALCLEKADQLLAYYKDKTAPVHPAGPQLIGTNSCESGFYVQSTSDGNYAIWTRMENSADGNTDLTPADWPEKFQQFDSKNQGGQYYTISVVNNPLPKTTSDNSIGTSASPTNSETVTPNHPKVKRTVSN